MFEADEKTRIIEDLLLEILKVCAKERKTLVIAGGFAIEIEAGCLRGDSELTRNHGDLDLHPIDTDIEFWKAWFTNKDFVIAGNHEIKDISKGFVAYSSDWVMDGEREEQPETAFYTDAYGVHVDENGIVISGVSGKYKSWEVKWKDWIYSCTWKGLPATVINHENGLSLKRDSVVRKGLPFRDKDIHDHKLFGVDIPKF